MPQHPDATVDRLQRHLRAIAQRYPHAWPQIADFRQHRQALGSWPRWCYCPMAGAYAVVSGGRDTIPPEQAADVAVVSALAAWRATQGLYRYDPDLLAALWNTPLEGALPDQLLEQLPEWCVYIETPGHVDPDGVAVLGFFAHLEHDANSHRTELRLLLDRQLGEWSELTPLVLHLGHGTLAADVAAAMDETERQARGQDAWTPALRQATEVLRHGARAWTAPLVSVLLYLCAEAAELRDTRGTDRLPRRPAPLQTKRGPREVAPATPTVWEVGWRIGAALRLAREQDETGHRGGTHAAPRAHLRRAHWHHYWSGHRTAERPGERLLLRWIHPVLIGAGDVVPTVHQVE